MTQSAENHAADRYGHDHPDFRRYLVNIDSISTHQLFTDCLVIGSGIAGLRAALEAAEQCPQCAITLQESESGEQVFP